MEDYIRILVERFEEVKCVVKDIIRDTLHVDIDREYDWLAEVTTLLFSIMIGHIIFELKHNRPPAEAFASLLLDFRNGSYYRRVLQSLKRGRKITKKSHTTTDYFC